MQPDVPPSHSTANTWQQHSIADGLPDKWHRPLALLAAAAAALVALTAREWGEMLHQWWNIETYNHIILVIPLIAWLVVLKSAELAKIDPHPWLPGFGFVVMALGLWLFGRITGLNLIAHAGAVSALQAAIITLLGVRVALLLALPIAFLVFLVPFGDEIIPPLQMITAKIAIALTQWSGIDAEIDGILIYTPAGLFVVAEACSGVKFLIAMMALAVLVCFTRFISWRRRLVFLIAAVVLPIVSNGVRAWGTIYIAQSQGVEFAAGFDHIFYGWIFFALVVAVLLIGAWRFFERDAERYGWTVRDLSGHAWIDRVEAESTKPLPVLSVFVAVCFLFGVIAAIVAPVPIG